MRKASAAVPQNMASEHIFGAMDNYKKRAMIASMRYLDNKVRCSFNKRVQDMNVTLYTPRIAMSTTGLMSYSCSLFTRKRKPLFEK